MDAKKDNGYYESLFLKLLQGGATDAECGELEEWMGESEQNREALTEIYRVYYALDAQQTLRSFDPVVELRRVNRVIAAPRRRIRRRWAVGIAASVAVIVCAGIMLGRRDAAPGYDLSYPMPAAGSQVSLVLADGTAMELEGERPALQYDRQGRITVDDRPLEVPQPLQVVTNQLIVPKGRRSFLELPDGTQVWVNSDSRIVFPAAFGPAEREVFVEGEVYMDVARDESRPFTVKTAGFSVNVLGTAFNICAYPDDGSQSVILARGSVKVTSGSRKGHVLVPNEMLTYADGEISVRKVDANDYTSWVTGVYSFRSAQLKDIGERLARYYGTPVVFSTPAIGAIRCSGKLELNDAPERVYETLAQAAGVEYADHGSYVEFRARGAVR